MGYSHGDGYCVCNWRTGIAGEPCTQSLNYLFVALAIVDDLCAVVVIAVFYTDTIAFAPLMFVAGLYSLLLVFNFIGIRKSTLYLLVAVLFRYAMLQFCVHATLAGMLAALTIPTVPRYKPELFSEHVKELMQYFDTSHLVL